MVWEGRNKLKVSIDFRFQRASGPPLAKANKCVNDSDFENEQRCAATNPFYE